MFPATSDNEGAAALSVDLVTNFVGSVRCTVHTLALVVNDVFVEGTEWQHYMNIANKITFYFNHHPKAKQLLVLKQFQERISNDRI